MTEVFTWADVEADQLLTKLGIFAIETKYRSFTEAGNYIIALAEKIKAQRSAAAMQIRDKND